MVYVLIETLQCNLIYPPWCQDIFIQFLTTLIGTSSASHVDIRPSRHSCHNCIGFICSPMDVVLILFWNTCIAGSKHIPFITFHKALAVHLLYCSWIYISLFLADMFGLPECCNLWCPSLDLKCSVFPSFVTILLHISVTVYVLWKRLDI